MKKANIVEVMKPDAFETSLQLLTAGAEISIEPNLSLIILSLSVAVSF